MGYRAVASEYAVHACPLAVTAVLLYLMTASVYWQDLGEPHQNSILNGLQFVTKLHEILILASMTTVVLHKVRSDLVGVRGVPLGYLTSPYQLGSPTYLLSKEYWGGATSKVRGRRRGWVPLSLLLAFSFILAPIVGPASAVVLIPSLDWWKFNNPLNNDAISVFLPLQVSRVWPTTITSELLSSPELRPESDGCDADMAYEDPVCPLGGGETIMAWAIKHMSSEKKPNITVTDPLSGSTRYLTADTFNSTLGWAVSSVISLRPARDVSDLWQYLKLSKLPVADILRPSLHPSLADSYAIKKPVVQTQCKLYKTDSAEDADISFPVNELRSPLLKLDQSNQWRIPSDINVTRPLNGIVDFHWVDMSEYTSEPGLLGAVLVSTTPDGATGAFVCTVLSHWAPVKIWGDPAIGSTIYQDSAVPTDMLASIPKVHETEKDRPETVEDWEPIKIEMSWANSLNLPNRFPAELNPSINLTYLETSASSFGFLHANLSWRLDPPGGEAGLPWIFSSLLSMHVADGLSRVNSGFPTVLYHLGQPAKGVPDTVKVKGVALNLNNINIERWIGMPLDSGVGGERFADQARTTNASRNTEIFWEVGRLGYGWGFDVGLTVILGTLILLLHAFMALAHIIHLACGDLAVNKWAESPGEIVALAWHSREPEDGGLNNTSVGISKLETWRKRVRLVVRDTPIESEENSQAAEDGLEVNANSSLELILSEGSSSEIARRVQKGVHYS